MMEKRDLERRELKEKKGEGMEGEKGDIGNQGAKAGLRYRFSSVIVNGDPDKEHFDSIIARVM